MTETHADPHANLNPSGTVDTYDGSCDWHGCDQQAVEVFIFHRQPGHVHDCAAHAASLREWSDVAASAPMPCPFTHDGTTWTARPKDLK